MEGQNTVQESESLQNSQNAEKKRTGKTRQHYLQQKNQQFAYFRINKEDVVKLEAMQFNIYDFISASFAFSQPKKELAIGVLNQLKARPTPFQELVTLLSAKKGSLFLVCLSLERAGLIERSGKGAPYALCLGFSTVLTAYSNWWKFWVEH